MCARIENENADREAKPRKRKQTQQRAQHWQMRPWCPSARINSVIIFLFIFCGGNVESDELLLPQRIASPMPYPISLKPLQYMPCTTLEHCNSYCIGRNRCERSALKFPHLFCCHLMTTITCHIRSEHMHLLWLQTQSENNKHCCCYSVLSLLWNSLLAMTRCDQRFYSFYDQFSVDLFSVYLWSPLLFRFAWDFIRMEIKKISCRSSILCQKWKIMTLVTISSLKCYINSIETFHVRC